MPTIKVNFFRRQQTHTESIHFQQSLHFTFYMVQWVGQMGSEAIWGWFEPRHRLYICYILYWKVYQTYVLKKFRPSVTILLMPPYPLIK